jgi:hypothetical protein
MPRSQLVLVGAAIVLTACSGTGSGSVAGAPVERDSSGVHIVENPPHHTLPTWRVDSLPFLSLGVAEGDADQEFGTIGGVALLNDGLIAVLDGHGETAFTFRIFDGAGTHVATHGRLGRGPGDFTWVNHFGATTGDTIVAVDFPNRRLNYLTVTDGYRRSLQVDEEALRQLIAPDASGLVEGMVPFDDSSYAIKAFRPRLGGTSSARFTSFHLVDLRSGSATELTRHDEPRGVPVPALSAKRVSAYPVEPDQAVHVVDRTRRRLCVAVTTRTEIQCLDATGQRRIVRWHADSVRFGDGDRKSVADALRANLTRGGYLTPAESETYIGALEFPRWFNPFTVLRLDDAGNFWILERIRGPDGAKAERFRIIDPSGRQIAFAAPFPVRNIGLGSQQYFGRDAILRVYDEDDVQKVGMFPIRRQ